MQITDYPGEWRSRLRPASFRGAQFHVETGGKASGRRIVLHEYPKRDIPYAEDMGRRAIRFTITAYVITSPSGENYLATRDALINALEGEGPSILVHPTMYELMAAVENYSVTETRERGGYAEFQITFVEAGSPGNAAAGADTAGNAKAAAGNNDKQAMGLLGPAGPGGTGLIPADI